MSPDLVAHIFKMFDICPEALALGAMRLRQDLNFPLKIEKKKTKRVLQRTV